VIVKKIGTSKTAAPKSKASNMRALIDYIAGVTAGGDGEKVEHRGALNLLNIDHDGQVQEMIDLAEVARRSQQPVQHWILSWREGEQPTRAQADETVGMFLAEMGLGAHQAIYALHRDTHNWHVHIAVNRVHPATEKVVTVNNGFDLEIAHRAIARIEQRQGWEREARGLYAVGTDGRVDRVRPREQSERQPSDRARNLEERTGQRSAERIAIEAAGTIVRQAQSWRELHTALAAQGMRYEKKGSGALLWIGDQPVKASTAGRDCSMAALLGRLGDFETALAPPARASIPARAVDDSVPTLRVYLDERREHYREREARRARATHEQRGEWRDLADRHRKQRADIFRGSWRGKGDLLNATRSVLAARQAQEKAAVRERQQMERAALRLEQGPFPSYEDWLARRDRDQADRWRHRDRRPSTIEGATFEQPAALDIRAFTAVLDGGRVHYRLAGSRRAAFTDHGKAIDIHASRNRESVLAALQLSAQKWGTISVHGNRQFMRICVELAAEHGFKIANPDLQEAIAAQRQQLRLPNGPDTRAPSVASRPESLTLASIYRRHIDEILREQPRARPVDASRLDADVAIRMAVTGHSREQIAKAILDGARTDRPNEDRDWQAYARRVVQHVFSPPGEEARLRLQPLRDRLLRIEGREDERQLLRRLGGPSRGF
jgi:MobA/VirD2-like, nuclease domain/Large polyvalent protein-associated domain 7/TraI-like middle domain/RepB DNA-primase C-terminal helical domain